MIIREFLPGDYETVKAWWDFHWGEGNGPGQDVLSDTGYIVENVCAAWLYYTNSRFAFIAWPVANPDLAPAKVDMGLSSVLNHIHAIAKDQHIKGISTYTKHSGLLKLLARLGYNKGDELVTNMILGV